MKAKCDGVKSCELSVVCECGGEHSGDFGNVDNCFGQVKTGEIIWYCVQ